ncbi:hypothetical protein Q5752_000109 [Cryptotrichosporon argae]
MPDIDMTISRERPNTVDIKPNIDDIKPSRQALRAAATDGTKDKDGFAVPVTPKKRGAEEGSKTPSSSGSGRFRIGSSAPPSPSTSPLKRPRAPSVGFGSPARLARKPSASPSPRRRSTQSATPGLFRFRTPSASPRPLTFLDRLREHSHAPSDAASTVSGETDDGDAHRSRSATLDLDAIYAGSERSLSPAGSSVLDPDDPNFADLRGPRRNGRMSAPREGSASTAAPTVAPGSAAPSGFWEKVDALVRVLSAWTAEDVDDEDLSAAEKAERRTEAAGATMRAILKRLFDVGALAPYLDAEDGASDDIHTCLLMLRTAVLSTVRHVLEVPMPPESRKQAAVWAKRDAKFGGLVTTARGTAEGVAGDARREANRVVGAFEMLGRKEARAAFNSLSGQAPGISVDGYKILVEDVAELCRAVVGAALK